MNDDKATHLKSLRSLHNHRVAEGDPDVRGWDVFGADGKKIGLVDDLLVDTQAMSVRYLDVILGEGGEGAAQEQAADTAEAGAALPGMPLSATAAMGGLAPMMTEAVVRTTLSDEENRLTSEHHYGPQTRHVLIPIGDARLDPELDRILVGGLRSGDAAGLPDYAGQNLDRDYEVTLRQRFDQAYTPAPERDFYAHDLYDENRFYAPRRQRTDSATASPARTAGLEPGGATYHGGADREITGELDRAVDAPDHSVTRDDVEAALPVRGR